MENDFDDDMLEQSESLDSDEVRDREGDEVVDPPDKWFEADDNETLDEKLAAETPDNPGEELDRINPTEHGHAGPT